MNNDRDRLSALFRELPVMPDTAPHVHSGVMLHLAGHGYRVIAEFPVTFDDGKHGRVDIAAQSPEGKWVGIEIDARKPRRRSLRKLLSRDWIRCVLLRGVDGCDEIPGIDLVMPVPVRMARASEAVDKRAVSRATSIIGAAS